MIPSDRRRHSSSKGMYCIFYYCFCRIKEPMPAQTTSRTRLCIPNTRFPPTRALPSPPLSQVRQSQGRELHCPDSRPKPPPPTRTTSLETLPDQQPRCPARCGKTEG